MTVETRIGMPLDQLIEESNQHPFEIIGGEKVERMPTVAIHSEIIHLLFSLISAFCLPRKLGTLRMETTYILPDRYTSDWIRGSRIPDILFYDASRLQAYYAETEDWQSKPYMIVPDLVVEVLSPNDGFSAVDAKVDAYRDDGVLLIWLVDPQRRKVTVHRLADIQPQILTDDQILSGEDVIPGLEMKLDSLFAPFETEDLS